MKAVSCGPVLTRGPGPLLCATRTPIRSSPALAPRASSSSASPALGGSSMGQKVVPAVYSRKTSMPRARRAVRVNALFEKFTERSIKSVMQSQQEAKFLGASEVSRVRSDMEKILSSSPQNLSPPCPRRALPTR
jgi:hypothetical protein